MSGLNNTKRPNWWMSPEAPSTEWHNPNWMASLPDTKHLSELSIPGTHATMTFNAQHTGNGLVICQSWGLAVQMLMGIRFFDLGCQNFDSGLPIYYENFDLNCTLSDVLWEVTSYLSEHPQEAFVMNVYQTSKHLGRRRAAKRFFQKLNRYLDRYSSFIYRGGSTNPTVAEMRGKIVVINDDLNSRFNGENDFVVEDCYSCNVHEKLTYIRDNLDRAHNGSADTKILTFTSYRNDEYVGISSMLINPCVNRYIRENRGRLGIIASDFPGPELIGDIIYHN